MDSAILLIAVLILTALVIALPLWRWTKSDHTPKWSEYKDPRKESEDYDGYE